MEYNKMPLLYGLIKIHKPPPYKIRPVTDVTKSLLELFSRWCSKHLKSLLKFLPTQISDTQHLIRRLLALGTLPPYARIFTADAVGMYTNINLEEAIHSINTWLRLFAIELPNNFPNKSLLIQILRIIMSTSVFIFGSKFYHQERGVAMGTPSAGDYANVMYGTHERLTLLPDFNELLNLLCRFIDDSVGIWADPNLPPNLTEQQEETWFRHNDK